MNTRGRCRSDTATVANFGLQPGLKPKTLQEPSAIPSRLGYTPNPLIPQMNVTETGRRVWRPLRRHVYSRNSPRDSKHFRIIVRLHGRVTWKTLHQSTLDKQLEGFSFHPQAQIT